MIISWSDFLCFRNASRAGDSNGWGGGRGGKESTDLWLSISSGDTSYINHHISPVNYPLQLCCYVRTMQAVVGLNPSPTLRKYGTRTATTAFSGRVARLVFHRTWLLNWYTPLMKFPLVIRQWIYILSAHSHQQMVGRFNRSVFRWPPSDSDNNDPGREEMTQLWFISYHC